MVLYLRGLKGKSGARVIILELAVLTSRFQGRRARNADNNAFPDNQIPA